MLFLLYADDLKVFCPIRHPSETNKLQDSAHAIHRWCLSNGMMLNLKKCNVITFTRKHKPYFHDYSILDTVIERVAVIKDLGVWFDSKLNFKSHMNITVAKAKSVLSLIKRFGREFDDLFVTKTLYTSLVRPIIEYGNLIWMPAFDIDINRIESIQKQFLLFCLRGLGWREGFHLPSYRHRLNLLDMLTLRDRQEMSCCTFIFDIINNNIISASILSRIQPSHQHYNLRRQHSLQQHHAKSIYSSNCTISRCIDLYNKLCNGLTTTGTKTSFKSDLKRIILQSRYK